MSLPREKSLMVRPLSRKDIFYSGSVVNLKEYQSQKSLTNYRQSVLSIPNRPSKTEVVDGVDVEKAERKFNNLLWETTFCFLLSNKPKYVN